jgi:poly(A) polymerase/tRNA nucleotidyltransferase (CCA-adding enzyme)
MTDIPALRIAPPEFLSDPALRQVLAALPDARLVGGCVRDSLAGIAVADLDLATPARPEQVMEALARHQLRAVPTGLAHGTITAVVDGKNFEITTLRRDISTDGRHAEVEFTADWRQDASRRDFTINALSMTSDGAIYDYFDGIADLKAGRLRFVGDPATRLAEDRLRTLRFFRFYARYARRPPDPATRGALQAAAADLQNLSAERVWSELKRILSIPDPRAALALMAELGVLPAILPEGFLLRRLADLIEAGAPTDPLLRLAALLDGNETALAERLRLSGEETARLLAIRAPDIPPPDADDATLRRLLADTPNQILIDRLWLAGQGPTLRNRVASMPRPIFPLAGRDALALGFSPGPAVGDALRAVRQWWLEGGCTADAAACREQLARQHPSWSAKAE